MWIHCKPYLVRGSGNGHHWSLIMTRTAQPGMGIMDERLEPHAGVVGRGILSFSLLLGTVSSVPLFFCYHSSLCLDVVIFPALLSDDLNKVPRT